MRLDLKTRLFAKLAIKANFVTEEQMREALQLAADQRKAGKRVKLTTLLQEQGLLGAGQIQAILRHMQKVGQARAKAGARKPGAPRPASKTPRFGELAVAFGMVQPLQVKEALLLQKKARAGASDGSAPKTGEILQKRGHMMPHQVRAILLEQAKKLADCPVCSAANNIAGKKAGAQVRCDSCYAVLLVTPRGDELIIDPGSTLAADPSKTRINQRVGNYIIEKRLGMDAVGKTYRGIDIGDHTKAAVIKVFSKTALGDKEELKDLTDRIREAAKIRHESLRRLMSMGHVDNRLFVVMEWQEGHSLRRVLNDVDRLPVPKVLAMGVQVGQALQVIHEAGLVHGDIRPTNLLMNPAGQIKLGGLGLNLRTTDNILNIAASGGAAPFYVAPEQVVDEGRADARSDIYSLGACMYHALTGRPPFEGSSPFEVLVRFSEDSLTPIRELNPQVPSPIVAVVERMIAAEPDDRFQTVEELLTSLKRPRKPKGKAKGVASGKPRPVVPNAVAAAVSSDEIDADVSDEYDPVELLRSSEQIVPAAISRTLSNPQIVETDLPLYYQRQVRRATSQGSGTKWLVGSLAAVILISLGVVIWAFAAGKSGPEPTPIGEAFDRIADEHPGESVDAIRLRLDALRGLLADTQGDNDDAANDRARINRRIRQEESALTGLENQARIEVQRVLGEVTRHIDLETPATARSARVRFTQALTALDRAMAGDGPLQTKFAGTDAVAKLDLDDIRARLLTRATGYAQAIEMETKRLIDDAVTAAAAIRNPDAARRSTIESSLDEALGAADVLWARIRQHLSHPDMAHLVAAADDSRTKARERINAERRRLGMAVASAEEDRLLADLATLDGELQALIGDLESSLEAAQAALADIDYGAAMRGVEAAGRDFRFGVDRLLTKAPDLGHYSLPPDRVAPMRDRLRELETAARETSEQRQAAIRAWLDDVRAEASAIQDAVQFSTDAGNRAAIGRETFRLADSTEVHVVRFRDDGIDVRPADGSANRIVPWKCGSAGTFAIEELGRALTTTLRLADRQPASTMAARSVSVAMFLARQGSVVQAARALRLATSHGADVSRWSAIDAAYEKLAADAFAGWRETVDTGIAGDPESTRAKWMELDATGTALAEQYGDTRALAAAADGMRDAHRTCFLRASGVEGVNSQVTTIDGPLTGALDLIDDRIGDVKLVRLRFRLEPDARGRAEFTVTLPSADATVTVRHSARTNKSDITLQHPSAVRSFGPEVDFTSDGFSGWHELRIHIDDRGRIVMAADFRDQPPSTTDPRAPHLGRPTLTPAHGTLTLDVVQVITSG